MFPEASTLEIRLFRETGPSPGTSSRAVRGDWSAHDTSGQLRRFSWHDRVRDPVLGSIDARVFASYGVDAQLARLGHALDDVAEHIADDAETRQLRAEVVVRKNGAAPATRMALYGQNAVAAGVPSSVVAWLGDPDHASGLAKLAIATELFLAVGLWSRRRRPFALWWGVWFHLTIEATSRVEGFTWLRLAMYGLFATPDVGARTLSYDPSRPLERVVARVVTRLDWLARFRFEPRSASAPAPGLVVIDRDGARVEGPYAWSALARGVPLFFPFWLPLAALARCRSLLPFRGVPPRAREG
jgi:hypothetical protein